MAESNYQIHDQFKSFIGIDISAISSQVSDFVSTHAVKPVSIGIVHVDSAETLLFSLGYIPNAPGHSASLDAVNLGHVYAVHETGLEALDTALTMAASEIDNIICHELVVTSSGDFVAVFLVGE